MASPLAKIARLLFTGLSVVNKDFGVTADGDYGWHGASGGSATRYPGSDINWDSEAGQPSLNAVVAICLQYIIDKIVEPDLSVVKKMGGGALEAVPTHPALDLLNWANEEYRGRQLTAALAVSYKLAGNAYAIKVRGNRSLGTPQELWFVPDFRMKPVEPTDSNGNKTGGPTEFYALTVSLSSGGKTTKLIPRSDVVHIRNGIDPGNPRLGWSPFRALLRSLVSDNEIDTFTAVVLRNFGIAGAIVSPAVAGDTFDEGQPEELKRILRNSMTGDSRGDVVVPSIPIKIDHITRSPQDLSLSTIGERPQSRICACFGIDPAAVGLMSSGGKGEKYGSLRKEARESSYEQGILPMLSVFAEAWTQELLWEFGGKLDAHGQVIDTWIEYDYSGVRDLQPDVNAEHDRARKDFAGNGITLDEFRGMIGLAPDPDPDLGSRYYFQVTAGNTGIYGLLPDPGDPDENADDYSKPVGTKPGADEDDEDGD
jgi:hypothetical protein